MKFSVKWLQEWVEKKLEITSLVDQLTMIGFEVEAITSLPKLNHVIIGHVLTAEKHPNADRLKICSVAISQSKPLTIVCGAPNARADIKVAVALEGAILPNNIIIKKSKIRGVESCGMMCSERELGLPENISGILELPQDAPVGQDIQTYLELDDHVLELNITPNRGDCLSILGMAREVAAINDTNLVFPTIPEEAFPNTTETKISIRISEPSACPHYVARVIGNITQAETPLWIKNRLQKSGINSISPIVDVTNYVMLELGQPLHAFDLTQIKTGIEVRYATPGESLTLLDNKNIVLEKNHTLVIADAEKALALAGIMGGINSGINKNTKDIFLESAFFSPENIAITSQQYGLGTDSSYRFVRGVDPTLQIKAIERATQLILAISGGIPGSINEVKGNIPKNEPIILRPKRIKRILGLDIPEETALAILKQLGMLVEKDHDKWLVTSPAHRFDIQQEIDLIEELARIYGYKEIPIKAPIAPLVVLPRIMESDATMLNINRVRSLLVDRGYHEAITYSFVDPQLQSLLDPEHKPIAITNPISQEMSVMRTSLLPGLITALIHNQNRQQERVRIFETGICFKEDSQLQMLGGVVSGLYNPLQWGEAKRLVDFFDVKGDLETILRLNHGQFNFAKCQNTNLHPYRSANVYLKNELIGYVGELHPQITKTLKLKSNAYVFELDFTFLAQATLPRFKAISKFPSVSRDLAIIIGANISSEQISTFIKEIAKRLQNNPNSKNEDYIDQINLDVITFDLYQGEHVEKGNKSLALRLTFQHSSRTLTDDEISNLFTQIVKELHNEFKSISRS